MSFQCVMPQFKNNLFINIFILFTFIQGNLGAFRFVVENCFDDIRDETISDWLMKHGMVLHVVISCANSNNILNAINAMSFVTTDRVAVLVTSQMCTTLQSNFEMSDKYDRTTTISPIFHSLDEWYPEMTTCNNRTLVTIPDEALDPIELRLSSGLFLLSGDNIDIYPVVMKNKKESTSKCKSRNWATYLHAMLTNLDQESDSKHLIIYVYNENSKGNAVSSARFLIGPPHNLAEDQRNLFLNCRDFEEHICLDNFKLSKPLYRIGILEYPPFLMFTDKEKTKPIGIIVDMINILSSKMNFNYTFVLQDDYGEKLPNGSWAGSIASILNQEIDFVAADVSLRPDRAEVVEYSVPFIQGTTSVVIRRTMQSTTFGDMLRTHLRPFHWSIWLVICICLLISTGLLSYAYRPKPPRPVTNNTNSLPVRSNVQTLDTESVEKETWWSIMFQILGIFCQQGCNLAPTRTSGRVILYTVCLTSLAIYNFYTSVFISFTTVMKNTIPVNSLIDVLRDSSYQVGFVHNERFIDMFKESNTTLFKKAWAKMERSQSSFVQSNDEGIGKAYAEKYAFIDEFHSLYWYTSTNCSLKLLQDRFLPEGYYFIFPRGSSDILLFNKYLKRLIENGMINRFLSTHSPPVPQDLCDDAGTLEPVGLDRMAGLFICLGIGFSMTVISLWLEKIGRHGEGRQVKRVTIVMKK